MRTDAPAVLEHVAAAIHICGGLVRVQQQREWWAARRNLKDWVGWVAIDRSTSEERLRGVGVYGCVCGACDISNRKPLNHESLSSGVNRESIRGSDFARRVNHECIC